MFSTILFRIRFWLDFSYGSTDVALVKFLITILLLLSSTCFGEFSENYAAKSRAYLFYIRITGVVPYVNSTEFQEVWELIDAGNEYEAALKVTENKNLINIKLKNYMIDWTNRAVNKNVNTNDMLFLMLGLIRDNVDFREVLTSDLMYKVSHDGMIYHFPPYGSISYTPGSSSGGFLTYEEHLDGVTYRPGQIHNIYNNGGTFEKIVYTNIDNAIVDLHQFLQPSDRITFSDLDTTNPGRWVGRESTLRDQNKIAGVMTTDQFAREFYNAGTNRRALQYVFKNFLCTEYEDISDTTVDAQYVRRDVDRYPNNDVSKHLNFCIGCHAGQDSLSRAFYYHDRNANYPNPFTLYSDSSFNSHNSNKLDKNVVFADGFSVKDNGIYNGINYNDYWENLWVTGKNQERLKFVEFHSETLGGGKGNNGVGVKELGHYLSQAGAFSSCMAERMWEMVCVNRNDSSYKINEEVLTSFFIQEDHNMKKLIAKVMTLCSVENSE